MAGPTDWGRLQRQPTLKDVATRANVSWSTVSNVLHDNPHVRPETRRRVLDAVAETGYRPSAAGRQLRRGRSGFLTLAIPDMESYFARLAHTVITEARRHGYTVLIDETGAERDRERMVTAGEPTHASDGIIFSPSVLDLPQIIALKRSTPLVLLGEHIQNDDPQIDHVAIDNIASARRAMDHLRSIGRHNIGFLGNQPGKPQGPGDLRLEGYRQSLTASGQTARADLIFDTAGFTREEGERIAHQIADTHPRIDGLLCANDLLAIGAMHAFRQRSINVPQDIALVSWDDTPEGAYSYPALTSIAHDLNAVAATAIQLILNRIDGDQSPPHDITVPHQLKIRGSTVQGA